MKYLPQTGKTIKDLKEFTAKDEAFKREIEDLRKEVEEFSSHFSIPGNEEI